ncbi:hypothetical protein K0A97_01050 [Patescibacteria group bacterium]|nr:hypothetical protein [Patescibacteria group bacterium]
MLDNNLCILCGDSISDPICRGCYIQQVGILLNDLKLHPLVSEVILTKLKRRFPMESLNDTSCILCNREEVVLCRYCFSVLINRILGELNFSDEFIEDFGYRIMPEEIYMKKYSKNQFFGV